MRQVGIDIGSLNIGTVALRDGAVHAARYAEHGGDIEAEVRRLLALEPFREHDTVGVTGTFPRAGTGVIDGTLAQIEGARKLLPGCANVFAVGGQSFALYLFDHDGGYREHSVNPPCAAGTGSFIEQQAIRLGLTARELSERAAAYRGKSPVIATRCAVFAKTDVIHAMQEGYSLDAVCAGLCRGIARNLVDSLVKGRDIVEPVGLIGGVALNRTIASAMEEILDREVRVPEHAEVAGAVGAALLGRRDAPPVESLRVRSGRRAVREPLELELSRYPDLDAFTVRWEGTADAGSGGDSRGEEVEVFLPKRTPEDEAAACFPEGDRMTRGPAGVYMGVDIGSTSTKAAVITPDGHFVGGFYTATAGEPIRAMQRLIRVMERSLELSGTPSGEATSGEATSGPGTRPHLLGVATTGSGRRIIKELFGADAAVNEITAHARAAAFLHPDADTIIEIGGQDSKLTRLRHGEVYYSTMNYVCAAGTGSFIEEQAGRLELSLDEFASRAMGSRAPYTSDRCTVYMERDLGSLQAEGWSKSELAAAVLASVRDNYMAKVAGRTPLGEHIVFQGATARNRALVAAFEQLLGRPIHVSPFCHLTGAFGAALLCSESTRVMVRGRAGQRRTEEPPGSSFVWELRNLNVSEEVCRRCPNNCLLTVVETGGRRVGWGMKCGREYDQRRQRREPVLSAPERRFRNAAAPVYRRWSADREDLGKDGRESGGCGDGRETSRVAPSRAPSRVRIGIPRALYNVDYAPMWYELLRRLGFRAELTDPDRGALARGKALVNSDFCAPMVLAHGYVAQLLDRGVDFIFSPAVMNEADPDSDGEVLYRRKSRDAYYCYTSEYLPSVVNKLTGLDAEQRMISPLVAFNHRSPEQVAEDIHAELARRLPVEVGLEETRQALLAALESRRETRERWIRSARRELEACAGSGDPAVVLLGRPYLLFDPVLNMGLPAQLEQEGARLFWQDELDLDEDEPLYAARYYRRMHWQYGKTIIKAAERAARTPGLYPVFLTSFRCSPDAFLLSYVKDILDHYDKPLLILQLDEHASDVGYTTRIEAGLQSFKNHMAASEFEAAYGPADDRGPLDAARVSFAGRASPAGPRDDELRTGDAVLIPQLDPLTSVLWAAAFRRAGHEAHVLDTDERALSTGYRYVSGGECMPLVSLIGGVVEKIEEKGLDPESTYFYIPTLCMACNFPNFPILADLAFETAGLRGVRIGLVNMMSPGDVLPRSLSIKILESNIVGGILYKLYHRVVPYERQPGEAESVLLESRKALAAAVLDGRDLRSELAGAADLFRTVSRDESGGRRPKIGLLGDAYVKFNEAVNQRVQRLVAELGGELIVPSPTEYPFHFYDADIRLHGDEPRRYRLLRTMERRYERLVSDLIGDQQEPDFAECVHLMQEYGITHYIAGETSINVGRALYLIRGGLVDAILHLNPIFCCPGVVTASIFRKMQADFGVPIIDIFYDGTGDPNAALVPHLHYLREKR